MAVRAGLPEPPRSACWFCPFNSGRRWSELRRDRPELFERAVELERALSARSVALGRDEVFFHRRAVALDQTPTAQDMLPGFGPGEAGCDNGACWT